MSNLKAEQVTTQESGRQLIDVSHWPVVYDLEKEYFFMVLKKVDNNRTKAAEVLGITLKSVYNKINRYYKEELKKQNKSNEGVDNE